MLTGRSSPQVSAGSLPADRQAGCELIRRVCLRAAWCRPGQKFTNYPCQVRVKRISSPPPLEHRCALLLSCSQSTLACLSMQRTAAHKPTVLTSEASARV